MLRGVFLGLAIVALALGAAASERVALVISAAPVSTPARAEPEGDARHVADVLDRAGYAVSRLESAGFDAMRRGLAGFRRSAEGAEVALIYFVGRVQSGAEGRRNYVLPADAAPLRPEDLAFQAMPLGLLRAAVRPARRMGLVVLDAREPPISGTRRVTGGAGALGLAAIRAEGPGQVVAVSARPGSPPPRPNDDPSAFAREFAAALSVPGLGVDEMLVRVSARVSDATQGRRVPAVIGALPDERLALGLPEPEPERGEPEDPRAVLEAAFVTAIANSTDPKDYEEYLARFPDGFFAALAERRLLRLRAAEAAQREKLATPPHTDRDPEPAAAPSLSSGGRLARLRPAEETPDAPLLTRPAPVVEPEPTPEPAAVDPALTPAEIRELQARLAVLGLYRGPLDGAESPALAEGIRGYERRLRRPVTGEARRAIHDLLRDRVPEDWVMQRYPEMAEPLVAGQARPGAAEGQADAGLPLAELRAVQARLAILGHDPGPVDGLWGQRTAAAVAAYQREQGLRPTGRLDRDLLVRLGRAVSPAAVEARLARPTTPEPQPEIAPGPAALAADPAADAPRIVEMPRAERVTRAPTLLRARPEPGAPVMATLPTGTAVVRLGRVVGGDWRLVAWQGRQGFLLSGTLGLPEAGFVARPAAAEPHVQAPAAAAPPAAADREFVPFGDDDRGGGGGGGGAR